MTIRPDPLLRAVQNISLRKELPAECQHKEALSSLCSVLTTTICLLWDTGQGLSWLLYLCEAQHSGEAPLVPIVRILPASVVTLVVWGGK